MTTQTSKLQLDKPDAGATSWSTEVNGNWDTIDGVVSLSLCDGRLTLESGVPISSSDQTAKTTLYLTPYNGNRIAVYNGTKWKFYSFTERSLAVPSTTNTNYDIFIYDDAGTLTLEAVAWTNDTTRATALTTQDGVYVKSGATSRRWLGTIRTTATSGQCEDSAAKRFVYNYYNQAPRYLRSTDSSDRTTTSTTFSQVGSVEFSVVLGQAQSMRVIGGSIMAQNAGGVLSILSIGYDSSTANGTNAVSASNYFAQSEASKMATLGNYISLGKHTFYLIFRTSSAGNTIHATGANGDAPATSLESMIMA